MLLHRINIDNSESILRVLFRGNLKARIRWLIVVASLTFLFEQRCVIEVYAQPELPSLSSKVLNLSPGMLSEEVERVFGAADTKSVHARTGRESWYYGSAVVFFVNGTVTAWSDDGTLLERQTIAKFQVGNESESDILYEGGWINAWTPQEPILRSSVLNELIYSIGG